MKEMPCNPKISKKFVSKKVKTVKWKPASSNFEKTNSFVTGSWGDLKNSICLWTFATEQSDPILVEEIQHPSNVNDLQYVSRDTFAVSGGDGCINLYQHSGTGSSGKLEHRNTWKDCHQFYTGRSAPCTALASNGEQIASVGEDGNLVILQPDQRNPLKTIESGGGCSEYAVVFVKSYEILTGNMQGHMKLWDIRSQGTNKTTLLSPDQVPVVQLAGHPTQNHLIAAGLEDGSLALWDMRSTNQPITIIMAHTGPITGIQFHPTASDHMFTCGIDGHMLHWDASNNKNYNTAIKSMRTMDMDESNPMVNVWFGPDVARGDIEMIELAKSNLPFNSLDVEGSTVLAASDLEAVYISRNVLLC